MDLKAIAKIFSPRASEETSQESGTARTCSVGHVLDPTWETCPFCDAEKRVHEKSPPLSNVQPMAAANDRKTRIDGPMPSAGRETRVDSGNDRGSPRQQRTDTRRITGVLITYTWQPSGEMFPVLEGKNRIGAGASSEEGHRPCEIQITSDPAMSSEHALILWRQHTFELVDLMSSNGTFLNDVMVSTQAVALESGAKIKAGNTVFQFVKFQLDPSAPGVVPTTPDRSDEGPPSRGTTSIE